MTEDICPLCHKIDNEDCPYPYHVNRYIEASPLEVGGFTAKNPPPD